MRVRTLATINTPQGAVPPGEIVTIPDAVFDRLRGKVEELSRQPVSGQINPTPEPPRTMPRQPDPPEVIKKADGVCYCCGSSGFWQGRGKKFCRVCHPPAPGAEVTDRGTTPSSATCKIDGDLCRITYTPDLYRQHGHRDGEKITVDGEQLTLKIERLPDEGTLCEF